MLATPILYLQALSLKDSKKITKISGMFDNDLSPRQGQKHGMAEIGAPQPSWNGDTEAP